MATRDYTTCCNSPHVGVHYSDCPVARFWQGDAPQKTIPRPVPISTFACGLMLDDDEEDEFA